MKRFGALIGAGIVGLALQALEVRADQPSVDPLIASMRAAFRDARAPRVEDLGLGHSWSCDYRSAESGSHLHIHTGGSYRFALTTEGKVRSLGDGLASDYRFSPTSLNGEHFWGKKTPYGAEHIRIGHHGELLVESTLPACSDLQCLFLLARDGGIENWRELLLGYSVCTTGE